MPPGIQPVEVRVEENAPQKDAPEGALRDTGPERPVDSGFRDGENRARGQASPSQFAL